MRVVTMTKTRKDKSMGKESGKMMVMSIWREMEMTNRAEEMGPRLRIMVVRMAPAKAAHRPKPQEEVRQELATAHPPVGVTS
jgi:hypothetical protein